MNKIYISNRVFEVKNKNLDLEVAGKCKITIINNKINNLNILVKNASKLIIEDFRIIDKENTNIKISIEDNSYLNYIHSFINNQEYNLNIVTRFFGNNSKIIFDIQGINDNGKATITADGVLGSKIYNELHENIDIVNINGGSGVVNPNIFVDKMPVIAEHAVTVGKINDNEVKYLTSKGMSLVEAKKLILNGFLINKFKSEDLVVRIKELIKTEVKR
ncbi:MAG: SufD family Fe-S cluster assembly protein [Bacilli bacterium]|nr:SufD family Fe-S cluster assembly protein [Bacilli bacterium]